MINELDVAQENSVLSSQVMFRVLLSPEFRQVLTRDSLSPPPHYSVSVVEYHVQNAYDTNFPLLQEVG